MQSGMTVYCRIRRYKVLRPPLLHVGYRDDRGPISLAGPGPPNTLRRLCTGSRFQSASSSGSVCWPTAASTVLRLTTLPRPLDQSLSVEHVNTSDQPRRQPCWYHPRVVRLRWSVIPSGCRTGLEPQHVRNAPSLSVFRRELKTVLFRSSFPDAIWQCTVLCLRARRSVLICHHVLAATDFVDIVRWSCSSSAITPPK